jgi:hypothetical protein
MKVFFYPSQLEAAANFLSKHNIYCPGKENQDWADEILENIVRNATDPNITVLSTGGYSLAFAKDEPVSDADIYVDILIDPGIGTKDPVTLGIPIK